MTCINIKKTKNKKHTHTHKKKQKKKNKKNKKKTTTTKKQNKKKKKKKQQQKTKKKQKKKNNKKTHKKTIKQKTYVWIQLVLEKQMATNESQISYTYKKGKLYFVFLTNHNVSQSVENLNIWFNGIIWISTG